jgi:hypothetical protein
MPAVCANFAEENIMFLFSEQPGWALIPTWGVLPRSEGLYRASRRNHHPHRYPRRLPRDGTRCAEPPAGTPKVGAPNEALKQEQFMRTITPPEHAEGTVARTIENQTAKLPSDLFLWAAVGSIATSATLKIMGQDKTALFVGQWAPTFLILGLYNKIVKVVGSD